MITLLAALGISLPSLLGGSAFGIALEVIGLIGKGAKAVDLASKLAGPASGTLTAPANVPADMTKPAAPATPKAQPLPPAPATA
jgi:hypothetical protein